jgi:hypothetical protein
LARLPFHRGVQVKFRSNFDKITLGSMAAAIPRTGTVAPIAPTASAH